MTLCPTTEPFGRDLPVADPEVELVGSIGTARRSVLCQSWHRRDRRKKQGCEYARDLPHELPREQGE